MYIYILKWEKFKDRFNYLFKIVSIVALWSYVLFSYQSPYVVISSFYRALEPSLNKLWIEDFIFGKKKFFFSKVFTRRICDLFTLLRFHTWNMSSITQRTVTGPIVVVRVMTIGDVHSTVSTLWLTLHHPLQQSPSHRYCRPIQFTRFIFFSPPTPLSSRRSRNRFADESIGNKITYLWTDGHRETRPPGNLDICQVFLPSNFKLRPIVFFYFNFQRNFRILWRMFTDV